MRSCLLFLILSITVNEAHSMPTELRDEVEALWSQKLLVVTSEEEIRSLNKEVSRLQDLFWLCEQEWEGQDLPLGCYQLIHSLKNSSNFHLASLSSFVTKLELRCSVALHHSASPTLSDLKQHRQIQWPPNSSCRQNIKTLVKRLNYIQNSHY